MYNSKGDFLNHMFECPGRVLKEVPVVFKVDHTYISGDAAIVEMTSTSTALNGRPYPQKFCWVTRFIDGLMSRFKLTTYIHILFQYSYWNVLIKPIWQNTSNGNR